MSEQSLRRAPYKSEGLRIIRSRMDLVGTSVRVRERSGFSHTQGTVDSAIPCTGILRVDGFPDKRDPAVTFIKGIYVGSRYLLPERVMGIEPLKGR